MAQSFELFRLSLLLRPQRDILDQKIEDPTREEYLREVFGVSRTFDFYKKPFHYAPEDQGDPNEPIIARVGRAIVSAENLPPEKGLKESMRECWIAALVVIDPRHYDDGQKIGFEFDARVGAPNRLIEALVNAINEAMPHAAYHIEVQPISDDATFWKFAEENRGEITSLTFDFIAPNMFGSSDEISNEMKDFQKHEKAQRVKIGLQSKNGLNTSTPMVKNSVNYATRGGGSIVAKTKKKKTYSSTRKRKRVTVSKGSGSTESWLAKAVKKISEIVGRE